MKNIPVNIPLLNGNEKKYLNECVDTGWISSEGPFVKRFEKEFASYIGKDHGISVTNGTVALDLAVKALGISDGDEVIIPSFTIISCASSVINAGAIPVVVDCDPLTWNMNTDLIEQKITPKTKAIMVVHIYGLPTDMDPVIALAKKHHLLIIEDAAEAHGLNYNDTLCGSFGDISTFSFYPNKHITTGEGGICLTSNDKYAQKLKDLRNLCFQNEKRFVHEELGTNARMTNMQAALGVAQLEKIEEKIKLKRKMGETYHHYFSCIKDIQLPVQKTSYASNIYWVYGIVLGSERKELAIDIINKLKEKGIGSRPFFYPIHQQPALLKRELFKNESAPVSENISRKGFYIPSGLGMNEPELEYVAATLKSILS